MKAKKRFTLAMTTALMSTTLAVAPALAEPEAPALDSVDTSTASQTEDPDVSDEENGTPETTESESPASSESTTPTTDGSSHKTSAQVKINPGKAKAKISNGKTDFSIDISYAGLTQGTDYQAQFTIKDKDGNVVADKQPEKFSAKKDKGDKGFSLSFDGSIGSASVSLDIVDKNEGIIASTDKPVDVVADEDGEDQEAQISTTASLDADVIQTGAKVDDTVKYEGLIPGQKYTVESSLMCKADEKDTGASKTSEFTAEESSGEYKVEGIEITDPDCFEQVVFETIKDEESNVVAEHTDINDEAQTVGDGHFAKKKKKKNPTEDTSAVRTPARKAHANANADANAQPTPSGGRAVIGSVPSGEFSSYGSTLFNR